MPLKVENKPRFEIQKGRAKTFLVTVKTEAGVVENLTGATVLFTVKTDYGGTSVFSVSPLSSDTGADWTNGLVAVAVTAANTTGVTIPVGDEAIDYVADLKVTLSSVPFGVTVDRSRTVVFRIYQTIS